MSVRMATCFQESVNFSCDHCAAMALIGAKGKLTGGTGGVRLQPGKQEPDQEVQDPAEGMQEAWSSAVRTALLPQE